MYKKCLSHHHMRVSSTVHITYIYISKMFRILQIIFEFLCSKLNNEKPFSFFTKKIFFNKTFFNSTFKLAQYTIIYYFICRIFWLHQFLILPSCLNQLLFSLTENIFRPQWGIAGISCLTYSDSISEVTWVSVDLVTMYLY